jgi:chaperonin GroES
MKIKPLNGYAVIKPLQKEEMTKSGIVIPDTANKEKPREGEIVAVSKTNITSTGTALPIELKVGDRVLYGQYSGEDVKVDGIEYKILEMTSIRAIVEAK